MLFQYLVDASPNIVAFLLIVGPLKGDKLLQEPAGSQIHADTPAQASLFNGFAWHTTGTRAGGQLLFFRMRSSRENGADFRWSPLTPG